MDKIDIIEAVLANNYEEIKRLLRTKVDINIQDRLGFTALHYAAQEYSIEIVKLLVDSNAEIDIQDLQRNTPLFKAVFYSKGRGDVIEFLLDNGADANLRNKHGVSPYELAKKVANYDNLRFFGDH